MEDYSSEDRFGSIGSKLDLLVHHLNQKNNSDSNMEQGVFTDYGFWHQNDLVYENPSCMPITPQHMAYQGSSNSIFQEEEGLSPVQE